MLRGCNRQSVLVNTTMSYSDMASSEGTKKPPTGREIEDQLKRLARVREDGVKLKLGAEEVQVRLGQDGTV